MQDALDTYGGHDAQTLGARGATRELPVKPVVLLVQSDPDNLDMYADYLVRNGYAPVRASNTDDAFVRASGADVIVTGIQVPGRRDGLGFLRRLKHDRRTRHVPVVVLTTCASEIVRLRAREAGCAAFLAKPCLPDELLREVTRLCPRGSRQPSCA